MADDEHQEFEDLGKEAVRDRVSKHVWSADKEKLAREWLELRETSLAREANDLARKANDLARKNNIIATIALIGAGIAIAISIISLFLKSNLGVAQDQL
jgi:hypothetical protein